MSVASNEEEPVSSWIRDLKAGKTTSAQRLWEAYYARLVHFAEKRLNSARRAGVVYDEEDIAQSAFKSFCLGAASGRYPEINDRESLWRLLLTITARKILDQARRQNRKKRGGTRVFNQADLDTADQWEAAIEQVVGREPSPEFAASVAEQYHLLLEGLGDDLLRKVALLKMEGFNNQEIAERIGMVRRSVIRKLEAIRRIWLEENTA